MNRSLHTLAWLGTKYRAAGPRRFVRRAVQIWADGGPGRLRDHWMHAGAAGSRERRYRSWMRSDEPRLIEAERKRLGVDDPEFARRGPMISIVIPAFDTSDWMLRRCLRSVIEQRYPHWEVVLVDDASPTDRVRRVAKEFAHDSRIRLDRLTRNHGIAAATNRGIELASGPFVALLDHDDELSPFALELVAGRIIAEANLDLIYSDEDKIDAAGRRHNPAFKPDFSPAYLLECNYICHLAVYRTELLRDLGGLRSEFNGAQDYDLVMRATERTRRIAHIPFVLYHWRTHDGSTAGFGDAKPEAVEAGRRAVAKAIERRGVAGRVEHGPFLLTYDARPELDEDDRVALLIRSGDGGASERSLTVDRIRTQARIGAVDAADEWRQVDAMLRVPAPMAPRYLLWMDGDLLPEVDDWLTRLIQCARLHGGPVTGRIVDAGRRVESAGLVIDHGGLVVPAYAGANAREPGYLWSLLSARNCDAAPVSCLLIERFLAERAWLLVTGEPGARERWGAAWNVALSVAATALGRPPVVDSRVTFRRESRRDATEESRLVLRDLPEWAPSSRSFIVRLDEIEPAYAPRPRRRSDPVVRRSGEVTRSQ
ncbi:MAG: glycosyltransferase [Phycisphaerales bacterium]